jgi:hypothetical protein
MARWGFAIAIGIHRVTNHLFRMGTLAHGIEAPREGSDVDSGGPAIMESHLRVTR